MIQQLEITLQPKSRGFHLVTSEIMRQLPKLPNVVEMIQGTATGRSDRPIDDIEMRITVIE